ncbi:MAG: hypothetical protein HSCHL_2638 [Hydrogenibacillus schlegelii]|uniref:Uncharacterized protein n=1 Tax=Hydrogenibacillus schlegelii TaxID=1484 RepID=A0A2T5G9K1_HYDSH|nr:MAG: hypothetical protein HSCHL_2638 [Hydrogenibacillus schlegelii]
MEKRLLSCRSASLGRGSPETMSRGREKRGYNCYFSKKG